MMLTKQNKTRFNYLSRLIVLPVAIVVFAAFTIKAKTYPGNISSSENKILTVVIDAGHGGKDIGGLAENSISEKNLNLVFAKKIKALNSNENIKLIFTRESDIYMSPQEKSSFARKAGADLFISIHMASSTANEPGNHSGMEVFVSKDQFKNSEASKLLASAVIGSFKDNYGLRVPSNPIQRQVGIWVLQDSQCPAVLIEAGYISDKNDLAYLKTEKAAEAFAKNILSALEKYRMQHGTVAEQAFKETSIINTDTIPRKNNKENQTTMQLLQEKKQLMRTQELNAQINKTNKDSIYNDVNTQLYREKIIALKEEQNTSAMQVVNLQLADMAMKEKLTINRQKTEVLNELILKQQSKEIYQKNTLTENIVFSNVEQEPQFPGGKQAWAEFLKKNLDDALPVKEGWKEGTYQIIVKFIVKEDGSVSQVNTENYKNTKTAQACIDLIKNGPSWIPAKQNGKTVSATRKQPITFVVNEQ